MSPFYIQRPLADAILADHHKVVIVEGARAVGKTMLVRQQVKQEGFAYRTLAEDGEYRRASANPSSWFKSLPNRVIIDEAQRIKELPLLIKEAADKSTSRGPQYILTGSASIGKSSLDGQDPLVRRAGRFTLYPLTQREIRGEQGSVIDDLWSGEINESYRGSCSREELALMMSVGGFPQYVTNAAIMDANSRRLSIRADIDNILGRTVVPGEQFDSSIAESVLQCLLGHPGNILNVNRVANMVGRDARTVRAYLTILVNRFLIRPLRNQKLAAGKQEFTRAKIHPVDSSFSMEAFARAGKDVAADPVLYGYMLESFVASQLLPAIEWSTVHPDAFFWREAGNSPKEVDFLFVRDGKKVGIEVKSSDNVDHGDFKNLRALATRGGLDRGYVVYMGDGVYREADNMWAIPVDALWRDGAFDRTGSSASKIGASARSLLKVASETPAMRASEMQPVANLFLSYNHADNDHLDDDIIQFVERVIDEYEYSYGDSLALFVDRQSIKWGEDWQRALDRGIEATSFLVPAVTPRYVRSAACRDELFKFYSRIEGNPNSHVLSLVWQPIDSLELDSGGERARSIIQGHQFLELSGLRDLSPLDAAYKKLVRKASDMLHEVIVAEVVASGRGERGPMPQGNGEDGLLEQLDEANVAITVLQAAVNDALEDVNAIAEVMNARPVPESPKPGVFAAWGAEVARAAQGDVDSLNVDLDNAEQAWASIYKFMNSYINLAPALGDGQKDAALTSLSQLKGQLSLPPDIDLLASQVDVLLSLSPKLKPMASALRRFIDVVRSIVGAIEELANGSNQA